MDGSNVEYWRRINMERSAAYVGAPMVWPSTIPTQQFQFQFQSHIQQQQQQQQMQHTIHQQQYPMPIMPPNMIPSPLIPPPYSTAGNTRYGNGDGQSNFSCHQCHTTYEEHSLMFCTTQAHGLRKRRCRKKYCSSCLSRYYGAKMKQLTSAPLSISTWQCPACLNKCSCVRCRKERDEVVDVTPGSSPQSSSSNSSSLAAAAYSTSSSGLSSLTSALGKPNAASSSMSVLAAAVSATNDHKTTSSTGTVSSPSESPPSGGVVPAPAELVVAAVKKEHGIVPTLAVSIIDVLPGPPPQKQQQQQQQPLSHPLIGASSGFSAFHAPPTSSSPSMPLQQQQNAGPMQLQPSPVSSPMPLQPQTQLPQLPHSHPLHTSSQAIPTMQLLATDVRLEPTDRCVYIMRGLPGSGKSFIASQLVTQAGLRAATLMVPPNRPPSCICSADFFFHDAQGNYRFDPTKLGEAHSYCMTSFLQALTANITTIVIDNTNTTLWEWRNYALLAQIFQYTCVVYEIMCPDEATLRRMHTRQQHQVSLQTVLQMWHDFEADANTRKVLPAFQSHLQSQPVQPQHLQPSPHQPIHTQHQQMAELQKLHQHQQTMQQQALQQTFAMHPPSIQPPPSLTIPMPPLQPLSLHPLVASSPITPSPILPSASAAPLQPPSSDSSLDSPSDDSPPPLKKEPMDETDTPTSIIATNLPPLQH